MTDMTDMTERRGAPAESRAREHREQKGPADPEPTLDVRRRDQRGSKVVDLDALELRADIARYLNPSVFPADQGQILESARGHHAPQPILELLESLPEGSYEKLQVVWEGLGSESEQRA